MRRSAWAVIAAVALSSCAGDAADVQAQREFDICMKQAEGVARTQGSDAGIAHIDQCKNALVHAAR